MRKDTEEEAEGRISSLKKKFIISAIFSVPLLYISMGHMMGLPLPAFLDPSLNPMNFAIAQLLLTIPVIICGYKFYTVGIKAIFRGSPNMDSLIAMGTSAAFIYSLVSIWSLYNGDLDKVHDRVLRERRYNHNSGDARQVPRIRFQGQDFRGHKETNGPGPQDGYGFQRWKRIGDKC